MQLITGLPTCEEAAQRLGFDVDDFLLETGVIAEGVTVDADPEDETDWIFPVIPEDCDIRWAESCLPPLTTAQAPSAAEQTNGNEFAQIYGLEWKGDRVCPGEAEASHVGKSRVSGISNWYAPSSEVPGTDKWRVWTQNHNGWSTKSTRRIAFVGSKIESHAQNQDADPDLQVKIQDWEPQTSRPAGGGATFSMNVSATVGPVSFGANGSWSTTGNQAGGFKPTRRHHYSFWVGKDAYPQGVRGTTVWRIPVGMQGDFQTVCAAVAIPA